MNADAKKGRDRDVDLGWVQRRLRGLGTVEPPRRLKERLLAAIPCRAAPVAAWRPRRWRRATAGAAIAAAVVVICGAIWFRTAVAPSVEVDNRPPRVLAVDHNSVRPADINALDSNTVY
jgi:hypothetical protein